MSQDTKTDIRPLLWQDLAEVTKNRVMDALRERLAKQGTIPSVGLLDLLGALGFEHLADIEHYGLKGEYGDEKQVWGRRFDAEIYHV